MTQRGAYVAGHVIGSYIDPVSQDESPCSIKMQTVPLHTAEDVNIRHFEGEVIRQGLGRTIRPPHIFFVKEWDDTTKLALTVMEHIQGRQILMTYPPQGGDFSVFTELLDHHVHFLQNVVPWLERPTNYDFGATVTKWQTQSLDRYGVLDIVRTRIESDQVKQLVARAIEIVGRTRPDELVWNHKHFEPSSIIVTSGSAESPLKAKLFSNVAWGYSLPYYDVVFGYHWYMLNMQHSLTFTDEEYERVRARWLDVLFEVAHRHPYAATDVGHALNLALLERQAASVISDICLVSKSEVIASAIHESNIDELSRILHILER